MDASDPLPSSSSSSSSTPLSIPVESSVSSPLVDTSTPFPLESNESNSIVSAEQTLQDAKRPDESRDEPDEDLQLVTLSSHGPRIYIQNLRVGSISIGQPEIATEPPGNTHRWTVYVKSLDSDDDTDIAQYIDSVEFFLHESFQPPSRVVRSPPFEISEQGWGVFEIRIRITPKHWSQQKTELSHLLKLYRSSEQIIETSPVTTEHLEQIIFVDPPITLERILENLRHRRESNSNKQISSRQYQIVSDDCPFRDEDDILGTLRFKRQKIQNLHTIIADRIRDLKSFLSESS